MSDDEKFAASASGDRAVSDSAAVAPVDAGGQIVVDLSCARCGYNLRYQPRDGRCPECATPVAASLEQSTIEFADPRWLRSLALGALLIGCGGWSLVFGALLYGLSFCLEQLARVHRLVGIVPTEVGIGLLELSAFAAAAMLIAGAYALTLAGPGNHAKLRRRGLALRILLATTAAGIVASWLPPGPGMLSIGWWEVAQILIGPLGPLGAASMVVLGLELAALARLAGEHALGTVTRIRAWLYALAWGVGGGPIAAVATMSIHPPATCCATPLFFASTILALFSLGLLLIASPLRLRAALKEIIARAEAARLSA